MIFSRGQPKAAQSGLREGDLAYVAPVRAAQVVEAAPAAMWAVYLMLLVLLVAVLWAAVAQVDVIARANARVIPEGREQVIASLEGGILRELSVREGQQVAEGDDLALLDPTRFEAQQAEGQAKRLALRATMARLQAESAGRPLAFPDELQGETAVLQAETDSYNARQQALNEAVDLNRRSMGLLNKELAVAEAMSAKGLMSEVEVMRVRRQVNDLHLQTQERVNRFRQEASAELVRVRNELAQVEEQMVVRDDVLRRTVLKSPVRGIVKTIKTNTLGGVVPAGATVMEIVPISARVLVEARIKPADIGFVKVGQDVTIKLSAYDYTVYGGMKGVVQSISPDVLGDPERAAAADATYYRALIRADRAQLKAGGKPLTILPGMAGTVDVRTGQRSVLSFMLRPMLKSQEAFTER
ncbi:HlyD family type I secretion periplasmic adaptor subunit [Rubrivivax sp. RP6-9]|uniref:HlyD family type I secretion periplasmic adaptor subunit n=1 Tax=Rubrivivax sp. RP6-9 TaxID=3415750 RepID=UPI003CC6CD52